jgi:L-arabinose isomerase
VWKPAPDLPTSAEAWLIAGGPHHTVLSTAVDFESLNDFASILGIELLHINASTTIRAFSNEVHWNNAYYRLAQTL